MIPEILRRISNLARFGTITETKSSDGKALARVKVGERVTDFLPVMSFSNSFRRHWIPIRPGEQALVVSPFGEADSGIVVRGIFNRGQKEPTDANNTTEIIEWEDGTRIAIDTAAKTIRLDAAGSVNVVATGQVSITSTSATITADSVTVDAAMTDVTGDLTVGGTITDARGDLTNFTTTDGAARG